MVLYVLLLMSNVFIVLNLFVNFFYIIDSGFRNFGFVFFELFLVFITSFIA